MKNKIKNILLWLAVFPASLAGMVLSSFLWHLIHNLTAGRYIDLNSWLNIIYVELVSNLIAGFVFVLIAYKIAPNNKKITAIIFTAFLILISGASLFIVNYMTKEYFTNIGIIGTIAGSIICCIGIYKGDFDKKLS